MTNDKCYIAGCITDGGRIVGNGYVEKFARAEEEVRALGLIPVNPVTLNHDHEKRWQDYMRVTLHAMLDCDTVYALSCWRRSKGATVEVQLALRLEKRVIYAKVQDREAMGK